MWRSLSPGDAVFPSSFSTQGAAEIGPDKAGGGSICHTTSSGSRKSWTDFDFEVEFDGNENVGAS